MRFGGESSGRRHAALAAFCYVALTALLLRNLLPVVATNLYADLGDPLLNCAILQWNATHLPLSREWWNFPSFAPLSGVTAFTEHLLGAYPLASPIIWATGNPVLAYNAVLFACFPLNALATFELVRELTGSALAAFVAGLAFGFAPFQMVHVSHVQTLMAFGMPLTLLGLHRYLRTARTSALVYFAGGWLCVLLSNVYTLVFFSILAALWTAWFYSRTLWRRFLAIAAVGSFITACVAPLFWGYHVRQSAYGLMRGYDEVKAFSAVVIDLADVSSRSVLWSRWLPTTDKESTVFPGAAIVCLVVVGLTTSLRAARPSTPWSSRLIWLSAACAYVLLARIHAGAFGWHFGRVPYPSFEPYQLASLAVPLLAAGVFLTGRFRAAWSRRDVVLFYFLGGAAMWLLALGPEPMWSAESGIRAIVYGPYWLLLRLSGAQSLRVPARAWLPAALCLAVCAGWGAMRLAGHKQGRWVVAALACLIVAEGWFFSPAVAAPLPVLQGAIPSGALVLDLPLEENALSADPQYLAVIGGYRVINGYSGYSPPHISDLRHALADHRPSALADFRQLADLYVMVRPVVDRAFVRWLETQEGIEQVADSAGWKLYRLPRSSREPLPPMPLPLPRRGRRAFTIH